MVKPSMNKGEGIRDVENVKTWLWEWDGWLWE